MFNLSEIYPGLKFKVSIQFYFFQMADQLFKTTYQIIFLFSIALKYYLLIFIFSIYSHIIIYNKTFYLVTTVFKIFIMISYQSLTTTEKTHFHHLLSFTSLLCFKMLYSVMIKVLEIGRNFLNLIKNIYKNPTTNIIFNDEKLNIFQLQIRKKARVSPLITPFQHHTGRST